MERENDYIEEVKKRFEELEDFESLRELLNYVNQQISSDPSSVSPIYTRSLTYYGNHKLSKDRYTSFTIPKKNGGNRTIYTPNPTLKKIQRLLSEVFQIIYNPSPACVGFVKNKSIKSGASVHVNMTYVYNLDIKNYFPSIHLYRVKKCFTLSPFNLNTPEKEKIAYLLANLCCIDVDGETPFLPQGAPTSPVLSNIICQKLDRRLKGVAKKYGLKYSRYADDITFSGMKNIFFDSSPCVNEIERLIHQQKFQINKAKVHLAGKAYRQMVTGLVVNTKVNVPRKYIQEVRSLLYLWERYGYTAADEIFKGKYYPAKIDSSIPIPPLYKVLKGKISYLKMIKGEQDVVYSKFNKRLEKLATKLFKPAHYPKEMSSLLKKMFMEEIDSLKYATHKWDKAHTTYDEMVPTFKKNLSKYAADLKRLDKKLFAKIYAFVALDNENGLKSTKTDEKYLWGKDQLNIGWATKELKEWCLNNPNISAFDYPLPLKITRNNKDYNSFNDIINQFKQEVQCRKDINQLHDILTNCKRTLIRKKFKVSVSVQPGIEFYTNVEKLENALNRIVDCILSSQLNSKEVKIEANQNNNNVIIKIVHVASKCNENKKAIHMLVKKGDFREIYKDLISIADWKIQAELTDGNKIEFPFLSTTNETMKNIEICNGFTHILTLYK